MGKFVDLTGQRFGRLTVIGRAEEDYRSPTGIPTIRWRCKCDCGKEVVMLRNVLKRAQSCGCIRAEKSKEIMPDLTGKRFGRWTVIGKAPIPYKTAGGAKTGWLCRCDCGNEKVVVPRSLTTGRSTSCGCQTTEKAAERIQQDGENVLKRYDRTSVSIISKTDANINSKTGVRGVFWNSREQKYIAQIGLRNKSITIGRFRTLEAAAAARKAAEKEYYAPIIDAFEKENDKND